MNLLVFSDNGKIIPSVTDALSSSIHQVRAVGLDELTVMKEFSDYDGIICDKRTWVNNAALFRYFGILDSLNHKPLLILTNESRKARLKLREAVQPVVYSGLPVNADDLLSSVEKLVAVVPEV